MTSSTEDLVLIGRLGRPHGLGGHLVLIPESDNPERFRPGAMMLLGTGERLQVSDFRRGGGGFIVAFTGFEDRNRAEGLRGAELFIPGTDRRPLQLDEYWPDELVGLAVRDQRGTERGRVREVDADAPQPRLLVDTPDGERLVPLVADVVTEISTRLGYLVVEDFPGLLSEEGSGEFDRD